MTNQILETIKTRSSIRAYQTKPLTREQLNALTEAALASPSAMNLQLWHFIVIENKAALNELEQDVIDYFVEVDDKTALERMKSRNNKVLYDAPCVIVISIDPQHWSQIDAGIAVQNIAIAAKSMGLDSVILGMPSVVFKGSKAGYWVQKLGFQQGHVFGIAIAVGYAAMDKEPHEMDRGKVSFIK